MEQPELATTWPETSPWRISLSGAQVHGVSIAVDGSSVSLSGGDGVAESELTTT